MCELIAKDGFDTVTVARTAARAGVSVGLVQHYFPSKDDLLLRAFQEVSDTARGRVAAVIEEGTRHERSIAAVLLDAFTEYLPLDGTRRTEHRVTRAFAGRSLDSPRLAEVDARTASALRAEVAQAVRNGVECGEVEPGTDADTAAVRLTAVSEGLATQVYRETRQREEAAPSNGDQRASGHEHTAARATAILRAELAAVFTGECRQYAR